MIHRLQRGAVPAKPHTVFSPDGELAFEHCLTRRGFEGAYTILYHRRPPHWVGAAEDLGPFPGDAPPEPPTALRPRRFRAADLASGGAPFLGRRLLLANDDLGVYAVQADRDDETLVENADGDELAFVEAGLGRLETPLGSLPFKMEDYVFVPRGLPHRWRLKGKTFLLLLEGRRFIDLPARYRTEVGQLRMDAPYTHRDFGAPVWPDRGPASLHAPRRLLVKRAGRLTAMELPYDIFDVHGWDGQVWPFTFPIRAFQPKTGLVHLPTTTHAAFAGGGFVVCSLVPRATDFHESAISCSCPHSSPDCDELTFHVAGAAASGEAAAEGSLTLHPAGIPHGPFPGRYEASIAAHRTDELAVVVNADAPLAPTKHAAGIEDAGFNLGWKP